MSAWRTVKKRTISHLIDHEGITILRNLLPKEWVHREYKPDYGIDFDVEVFDYIEDDNLVSLGEHFFVQLKSSSKVKVTKIKVFPRVNVEKQPLTIDKSKTRTMEVMSVQLDSSDFSLAQSMGPSVPTLLFLCDIEAESIYYVCLNDYVDKLLLPEGADFTRQSNYTVYVPLFNQVSNSEEFLIPLRFYARRAKLYAAFNKFRYQRNELSYLLPHLETTSIDQVRSSDEFITILHFASIARSYDFWEDTWAWPALSITYQYLRNLINNLERFRDGELLEDIYSEQVKKLPTDLPHQSSASFLLMSDIQNTWDKLANLGNMFEEICREWYLPTYLGLLAEESALR